MKVEHIRALAAVLWLAACEPTEPLESPVASEGEACAEIERDLLACDEDDVVRCGDPLWVFEAFCPAFAACQVRPDGSEYTCVDPDGAGGFCPADLDDGRSICAGEPASRVVLVCEHDGRLALHERCDHSCLEYELDGGPRAFCVAPDGQGDYCETGGVERCVAGAIHGCEIDRWVLAKSCHESAVCEVVQTRAGAAGSERAFCVMPDGLGGFCGASDSPEAPNKRCVGKTVQRCQPFGDAWELLDACNEDEICVETLSDAACKPMG